MECGYYWSSSSPGSWRPSHGRERGELRLIQIAKPNVLTLKALQIVFYFSGSYVALLAAAVLGIVSPSGNEGRLLAVLGAPELAS